MIRRFSAIVAAMACFAVAFGDVPAGYYDSLTGKTTSALKTVLHDIIAPHTEVSSYSALPSYFQLTDLYPGTERWWDMYSDIPLYAPSFKGLNREHSFPKSWWGGDTNTPAYVDLNHLYPAEAVANQAKNNYPLGVVTGEPKFDNGISLVGRGLESGGAPYVFEPDDEYKGDFARTYFYMVTCYQDMTWKYQYMARNGAYPSLQNWAIDLLLKWHEGDPVSQKELDRNEAVYRIQNNRNPFIDFPELAEYIWGSMMGKPFEPGSVTVPGGEPVLVTPVQDMALDFGQVAVGRPQQSRLYFKGENLTGQLELSISGADARCFSIETKLINSSLVNSASGYWLTVVYDPDAVGSHTARLRIQDGGLVGSRGIELRGECLPVPVLSTPVAIGATDVTSTSYCANWLAPADYNEVVDYYVVTRTMFRNGSATTEELLAEDCSLVIEGFDENDSETYSVQSVRLGFRSTPSNIVTVSHAAVEAVDAEEPLVVECFPGFVRFICGEPHEDVAICDASGRVVMILDRVSNGDELTLAPGVYVVASPRSRRPQRIVAR